MHPCTTTLSGAEKVQLIDELLNSLNVQELFDLEASVAQKRKSREEETRELLLSEFRERAESMGMKLESLLRRTTQSATAKYRNPETGQTWSGRGVKAKWIKELEAQGRNIEEFRVQEE
jgi:DNA-binding protein H-NS